MKPLLFLLLVLPLSAAGPVSIPFWVEPCRPATASGCALSDVELAEWALEDWAAAAAGRLSWKRVQSPIHALFRLRWAPPTQDQHGAARPFLSGRRPGSNILIRPGYSRFPGPIGDRARSDPLYRDTVVYLTCLHEIGHALGMNHALAPGPIMYNGPLLPQVFDQYRDRVHSRADLRRLSAVSEYDRTRLHALLALQRRD